MIYPTSCTLVTPAKAGIHLCVDTGLRRMTTAYEARHRGNGIMNAELEFDLVAIGGGFAGLVAAVRAPNWGCAPRSSSRATDERYLCSSRWAGGIFHVSYHDVTAAAGRADRGDRARRPAAKPSPSLAAAIAEDCARTVDWLGDARRAIRQRQPDLLAPLDPGAAARRGRRAGLAGPRPGPDARRIAASGSNSGRAGCCSAPGRRRCGCEGGRCVGLVGAARRRRTRASSARAVVIADGGFPGRPRAVPPAYRAAAGAACCSATPARARGDGIRMAEAAGAALTRLDRFYGHLMSRDAMAERRVVAVSADRRGGDRRHRRRPASAGGCSTRGSAASRSPTISPGSTTRSAPRVICDAPIWETAGRAAQIPPNPQLEKGGGTLHRADTIAELAAPAGHRRRRAGARPCELQRRGARGAARGAVAAALDQERRAAPDRDAAVLRDPDLRRHHQYDGRHRDRRARPRAAAATGRRSMGFTLPAAAPAGSKAAARSAMSAG